MRRQTTNGCSGDPSSGTNADTRRHGGSGLDVTVAVAQGSHWPNPRWTFVWRAERQPERMDGSSTPQILRVASCRHHRPVAQQQQQHHHNPRSAASTWKLAVHIVDLPRTALRLCDGGYRDVLEERWPRARFMLRKASYLMVVVVACWHTRCADRRGNVSGATTLTSETCPSPSSVIVNRTNWTQLNWIGLAWFALDRHV